MSRSLSFECEWVDQPAAADALERRTWACLRIHAAGRALTRIWDRRSEAERVSLFIPAFPLARWIVDNWWTLLYEPGRSDEIPAAGSSLPVHQQDWIRRHCLRSADSGLLLPRAFFFSDGRRVCVNWFADEIGAYERMPGEFLEYGIVRLDRGDAEEGLRAFIRQVVDRIGEGGDDRSTKLCRDWNSIISLDGEELPFCRAAGRLGLDPYRVNEWPDHIVSMLEGEVGDSSEAPITADFLEAINVRNVGDIAAIPLIWNWTSSTLADFELQSSPSQAAEPRFDSHPARNAYRIAQSVRRALNGTGHGPLTDLSVAAATLNIPTPRFEPRNHLPDRFVQAAVGWQRGVDPIVAGPFVEIEANRRFLEARAIYLAAFACHSGPRLITSAHTWDQKASRAFAAELLAPQAELVERVERFESQDQLDDAVETLAAEFKVSTKVIEHQLTNAGCAIDRG